MFVEYRSITQIIFLAIKLFIACSLFTSCDLGYKKHIVGKYYVIGVDDNTDLSLGYELSSGDFVGKAPKRLIEYGFNDTFLVAKTQGYNQTNQNYYIIDMTKDSDYALEETFRIGPISNRDFDSVWKERLKIKMLKVK